METSFVRLTLEEHRGYIGTAMVEATFKLEVTKFCRTVARTYRAWKTERDAKHTMAGSNDVQRSARGQETPRIRAYKKKTRGRLERKDVLWGLAAYLNEHGVTPYLRSSQTKRFGPQESI